MTRPKNKKIYILRYPDLRQIASCARRPSSGFGIFNNIKTSMLKL